MLDWTTIYIVAAVVVVTGFAVAIAVSVQKRVKTAPRGNPYVEGLIALVRGDKPRAFSLLQQSIRSGTAPVDAYIQLGELLRENGDPAKALQIHKSLTVKTDLTRQQKIELFLHIGLDYSRLGQSEQSVKVLDTAVKSMGLKDPDIFELLARENHILGRTEEAYRNLKELKKAGSIGERELSYYLCTIGEKKAEEDNPREAKKLIQRSIKHNSENGFALLTLGNLEEKLDNQEAAIENWRKAATVSPQLSSESLINLERVMFQRGTFGDIEEIYQEVLRARPWDEHATLALASFYKKQGRGLEAIEFLEEYRSMHPESIATTLLLTSLYATLKDREDLEGFLESSESDATARRPEYKCSVCDFHSRTMRWHCPRCNAFDSFVKKDDN